MAFTKVHHVGLVNGDLDHARHILEEGFGLSLDEHRTPSPGIPGYDGTTVLQFPIGEMYYEVAKPGDAASEPAQYLEATNGRGGMYYLSLASNDIAADVQGLQSRGVRIKGDWDGKGPVFLDPETTLGLRLQVTPDEPYYVHPYYKGNGTCMGMAHIGLAGRDPNESRHFWSDIFGIREDQTSERGREGPDPNRERRAAADDPVHILGVRHRRYGYRDKPSHYDRQRHGQAGGPEGYPRRGVPSHRSLRSGRAQVYRAGCASRHGADRQHSAQRGYHAGDSLVPSKGLPWYASGALEPAAGRGPLQSGLTRIQRSVPVRGAFQSHPKKFAGRQSQTLPAFRFRSALCLGRPLPGEVN